jgi:hypothetical protein
MLAQETICMLGMLEKQQLMILPFDFHLLRPAKAEKGKVACLPIPWNVRRSRGEQASY